MDQNNENQNSDLLALVSQAHSVCYFRNTTELHDGQCRETDSCVGLLIVKRPAKDLIDHFLHRVYTQSPHIHMGIFLL